MKTIFDGKLVYQSNDELDLLVNQMDNNLTIDILESAIDYSIKMGVYNLDECFVLYNCISKLKKS